MRKAFIGILFFVHTLCVAQQKNKQDSLQALRPNHGFVEAGAFLSTGKDTPFWLRTNQYGIVPVKGNQPFLRGGIWRDYTNKQKLDWGYKAEVAISDGFYLPEAHVKAKIGAFEIYGGRKREIQGLVDTLLTSGSYIWSGNALPLPKIDVSIPNYTPILGDGLVSIKGNFAHGWFGNQGIVSKYYLHQKSAFVRIGKPYWTIKAYAGATHQAQWGGKSSVKVSNGVSIDGYTYPHSFKDYIRTVSGISQVGKPDPNLPPNDQENRVGNHLGTFDVGTTIDLSNMKIFIYRQSVFEDGSLYYLANIEDGLNGISLDLKEKDFWLKKITLEYFQSTDQGAGRDPRNTTEGDNYFNQSQYFEGWSYDNRTLGTPFITPNLRNYKIYRADFFNFSVNNKVKVWYLGGLVNISKMPLWFRISYGKNYGGGSVVKKITENQTSILLTTEKKFSVNKQSLALQGKVAIDNGSLYKIATGLYLGILKRW